MLLYYNLLLLVTAVFKGRDENLILLGFLGENVEFSPYLHLWKIGSE